MRRRRVPGERAGFTLIEVIITLIIIGIMAAATVPAFLAEDRRSDLDAASTKFDDLFSVARDSAVLTGAEVLVSVDSATGAVWFETRRRSSEPLPGFGGGGRSSLAGVRQLGSSRLAPAGSLGRDAPPTPGRQVSLDLPATVRVELARARASFLFTPAGAVMGDSIVLRSSSGQAVTLSLDPWSGRARPR